MGPLDVRKRSKRAQKLINNAKQAYTSIGALLYAFKPDLGLVYISQAEQRATELVDVAGHHPKLFEALENSFQVNDYWAFFLGHGMLALTTLNAFNIVPPVNEWPARIMAGVEKRTKKRETPPAADETAPEPPPVVANTPPLGYEQRAF